MAKAPSPPVEPFELSGGALALDFANTWSDRGRPETDRLSAWEALLAFGRQTGYPTGRAADRLAARARADRAGAMRALAAARELRETIARLLARGGRGGALAAEDLDCLNRALARALAHQRLTASGAGVEWRWQPPGDDLEAPLWPIARSAAELLTSADLTRVRECAAEDCTWLFLDRSPSRARRWCSMQSCGNRAKARRHYRRRRGADDAGAMDGVRS